jgi:hypothetical protein
MRDIGRSSLDAPASSAPDSVGTTPGKRALTRGLVQRRSADGSVTDHRDSADVVETAARGFDGPSRPLPHADRIQASFGRHDVSGVNAHVGGGAAAAAQDLGAHAYAMGNDVAFQRDPDLHTAAHEAAHVVQQRSGVYLKDGLGDSGDVYERHADSVADAVVRGESAEPLLDAFAGGGGTGVQRINDTATTSVSAHVTGHASPRWESPRGRPREELNRGLSQARADAVQLYLREMLNNAFAARGLPVEVGVVCRSVEDDSAPPAPVTTGEARGSDDTLVEAAGDTRANDRSMRRVDIRVSVTWHIAGEAPTTSMAETTVPEQCDPNATDQWAVSIGLSGGGGHAGVGGAFAVGRLKNRLTNQTAAGQFVGGGLGVGLQTPGVTPDSWGGYTDFQTDRPVTFEDFDGAVARLTTLGAGVFVGYCLAYLSFPTLGANSIDVGGFTAGNLGADGGTNVGVWNVHNAPGAICTPEHVVQSEVVDANPYTHDVPNGMTHAVYFETGSSEVTDLELGRLQTFVDALMANYDWPGEDGGMTSAGSAP